MARFDVYRNSGPQAADVPYLLDVQTEVLSRLDTRVVVPLRRRSRFPASIVPANLMPMVTVEGDECIVEIPKLAAVPVRILKEPVTSLSACRLEITRALDFLFQGF
ncbi:CcdB family protein [Methylococcus mesophilus]|uniref:CcdB family protein n=1 Tax=Methylococcus mesophilus TaxID=2993564 RepID=UPI00224B6EC5|nr:CcdB family protein [Methylococcus mesophilus]UZR28202.1 CcdB family protein [Methylococcus mesophilus]